MDHVGLFGITDTYSVGKSSERATQEVAIWLIVRYTPGYGRRYATITVCLSIIIEGTDVFWKPNSQFIFVLGCR